MPVIVGIKINQLDEQRYFFNSLFNIPKQMTISSPGIIFALLLLDLIIIAPN